MTVKGFSEAPIFDHETIWYLNSFEGLTGSRQLGYMALGNIPASEMFAYYHAFESIDTLEVFCKVIRAMDNVYLQYVKKSQPKSKTPKK